MHVCAVCEFRAKVRPITFGSVAMGSAVLYILRSRFLVYSAVSEPMLLVVVSLQCKC